MTQISRRYGQTITAHASDQTPDTTKRLLSQAV
jgi:hypothetical protein